MAGNIFDREEMERNRVHNNDDYELHIYLCHELERRRALAEFKCCTEVELTYQTSGEHKRVCILVL